MNAATTQLEQLQKCCPDPNGVRVPKLLDFPEKYHPLFIALGKDPNVASFTARHQDNFLLLEIRLKTPNSRFKAYLIKNMFRFMKLGMDEVTRTSDSKKATYAIVIREEPKSKQHEGQEC